MQDFVFPGYTSQWSVHYNHDEPTFAYDNNGFLVRPDPVGVFTPHTLDVAYLGWTGDGHINDFNINHAAYWALGRDSMNPIANRGQDISAFMAAVELSYDRDWMRFRVSAFMPPATRTRTTAMPRVLTRSRPPPTLPAANSVTWAGRRSRFSASTSSIA